MRTYWNRITWTVTWTVGPCGLWERRAFSLEVMGKMQNPNNSMIEVHGTHGNVNMKMAMAYNVYIYLSPP